MFKKHKGDSSKAEVKNDNYVEFESFEDLRAFTSEEETTEVLTDDLKASVKTIDECLYKLISKNIEKLVKIERRSEKIVSKLDKKIFKLDEKMNAIETALMAQKAAFTGIEDTFFTLYHNMKKNQWIYAKEPEDWWNDYLDLKKYYDEENNK